MTVLRRALTIINIIGQQENLWGCLQKHTRSAKTACNDV